MIDKAPTLRAALVFLLKFIFGAVLFVGMLALPRVAVDGTHDLGSQLLFEIYYKQGTKFGTEVIQNIGPYGFLTFPFSYGGIVPTEKLIYNFAFTFLFVLMVLWTAGRFEGIVFRISFIAAISYFFFQTETSTYIFFLMAACLLLSWPHSRAALAVKIALVPLLALLALTKAIFFFCALLVIGLACLRFSYHRRHGISLALVVVFCVSVAVLWRLAGQEAGNFVPFVVNALEFSNIYNEAMTTYEPLSLTVMGAALVGVAGLRLFVLFIVGLRHRDVEAIGVAIFFGLLTLLAWKHGFVRADGHMYIFFFYVLAAAPLLLLTSFDCERDEPRLWRSAKVLLLLAVIWVGVLGVYGVGGTPNFITSLAYNNLRLLQSLRSDLANLEQKLQANKVAERLDDIRRIVGSGTVDDFGMTPGTIPMNDLNYHGRPMPIRFMALGNSFEEKNAAFYRNPESAPQYVLMSDGVLDNRLLPQDDAPAFLELLAKYRVVYFKNSYILFKRRQENISNVKLSPLGEISAKFGDAFHIPHDKGRYVWACAEINSSLLGTLYSKIYKSPQINIRLSKSDRSGGGWPRVRKFIPVKGGSCFLVTPFFDTNWEFILKNASGSDRTSATDGSPGVMSMIEPDGMQFVTDSRHGGLFFKDDIKVRYFSVAFAEESIPAAEVAQQLFSFDRLPSKVEAAEFRPLVAYGMPASLAHAPARLEFAKPAGLGKLVADFGMLPSAFEGGGASDGVTFSVTFAPSAGGAPRTLVERTLDPVKVAADRGVQKLAVDLPHDEAGTVSIIIAIHASMNWDHSFLANIALTP